MKQAPSLELLSLMLWVHFKLLDASSIRNFLCLIGIANENPRKTPHLSLVWDEP
jgi:hypothetical protein